MRPQYQVSALCNAFGLNMIESGLHVITYMSRDVTGWQPDLDALNSKQPYFSFRRQLAASIKTYQIIQNSCPPTLSSRNPLGSLSFLNF